MKFAHASFLCILLLTQFLVRCGKPAETENRIIQNDILSLCNIAIQNAIVVDRVAAPVGSRRYVYASIAAYESLAPFYPDYQSAAPSFNGLRALPKPDTSLSYCLDLVALSAHTYVSQNLVYKEDSIVFFRNRQLAFYKPKMSLSMFDASIAYGDAVGKHIVKWSKLDSFNYYRGREFYLVKNSPGKWEPTATDFMDAIEPNWGKIRPVLLKSPRGFSYPAPEKFDSNKKSRFFQIANEVYTIVNQNSKQNLETALYWDDNPNSSVHYGHATINILKISPAGHWLSMFSNVARQKKYSLIQSADGMLHLSSVIFDAFIACWYVKYKEEYIRPISAIQQLLDSSWTPPIQTPAFPEFPSGHSTVSSAAATVLTEIFGEYSFIDSAENEFGLGVRNFKNFREASDQACISRVYGGIHFMDGNIAGKQLGNQVGEYHIAHLKSKK
ncbi:MAG: hypothetical protein CK532_03065 [Flavobacteriales bacterium]|nr:MAG: hypothetical protein CK532_03065 [Flavobacteriales bacterium]